MAGIISAYPIFREVGREEVNRSKQACYLAVALRPVPEDAGEWAAEEEGFA
jgi:hypothetical protein